MAPIPVYSKAPINAAKAAAVNPQTAESQSGASPPAPVSTTTSATSSYPAAQPGAVAFPGPTAAPQRHTPMYPSPTTNTAEQGPPAPQPGAVPTPLHKNTLPPPPKAGETYNPPAPTMPPQMAIPPPTSAYGSQQPTSTSTSGQMSYPIGIPAQAEVQTRRSLEHPPGYQQNNYASEVISSDQRRMQEANLSNLDTGDGAGGIWDTAKKWASTAGEKMQAAEAETWRRINKE